MIKIAIKILPHGEGLALPEYASEGAAAMDLRAALEKSITLAPLARAAIPTGIAIALPHGFEAQIRARSGLALKSGLMVLNGPGTIDSDYRGEILVILANLGSESVTLERGQRIAQMVIAPLSRAELSLVKELPDSLRGSSGFGSTGLS